jgi:hypothetical protein
MRQVQNQHRDVLIEQLFCATALRLIGWVSVCSPKVARRQAWALLQNAVGVLLVGRVTPVRSGAHGVTLPTTRVLAPPL